MAPTNFLLPRAGSLGRTQCSSGTSFYTCNANKFSGCCSVDPCNLEGCPDDDDKDKDKDKDDEKSSTTSKESSTTTTKSSTTSTKEEEETTTSKEDDITSTVEATPTPTDDDDDDDDTSSTESFITTTNADGTIETSVAAIDAGDKVKVPAGAIAGAVVGGCALFLLAAVLFFFLRRRRLQKQEAESAVGGAGSYYGNESTSRPMEQLVHGDNANYVNTRAGLSPTSPPHSTIQDFSGTGFDPAVAAAGAGGAGAAATLGAAALKQDHGQAPRNPFADPPNHHAQPYHPSPLEGTQDITSPAGGAAPAAAAHLTGLQQRPGTGFAPVELPGSQIVQDTTYRPDLQQQVINPPTDIPSPLRVGRAGH